jgi:beta-galactosidase
MIDTLIIIRGSFQLPPINENTRVTLFIKSICDNQAIYVNGHPVAGDLKRDSITPGFILDHNILKEGKNVYAVTGIPFILTHQWEILNTDPGVVQVFVPAESWKRKVFNGLAQIIVRSCRQPGEIIVTAASGSLASSAVKIETEPVKLIPAIPAR